MKIHQIFQLNQENITNEHICFAFASKNCGGEYENKKRWISSQFSPILPKMENATNRKA